MCGNMVRPVVKLIGEDGNAFAILGRCKRASKNVWTKEQWNAFHKEATSDDYQHLLRTVVAYFDQLEDDENDDEKCFACGCVDCRCE